jgi:molecular chaperone HscA
VAAAVKHGLTDADAFLHLCRLAGEVSRSQFDELIMPLVKRTLLACRRLRDAGSSRWKCWKW